MDRSQFRGVFVIVVTPFTDRLAVDEDGLKNVLRFCFDAGVQGVVATANASEVGYLSEAERRRVAEIVVAEARGRAASIVGVSASCAALSAGFARHAAEIGADSVMAMPPNFHKPAGGEIRAFYEALAEATRLPLVLQNASGPGATPMSPALIAEIAKAVPTVRLVKEETEFPGPMTSEILALAGDRVDGVMGGRAGITWLEEHRRGSCGTMPACEIADVHVAVWRALEAGDEPRAREIFRRLLPLLVFESIYGCAMYKETLRRRGVIKSNAYRQTGRVALDGPAQAELTVLLAALERLMHASYRPR